MKSKDATSLAIRIYVDVKDIHMQQKLHACAIKKKNMGLYPFQMIKYLYIRERIQIFQ